MNHKAIEDFEQFVAKEILPATTELGKLDDRHRKHLQKLVYTNLVNRFDVMVDLAVLDNCETGPLLDRGLSPLDKTVSEADILRLLLQAESMQDAIRKKVRGSLSTSLLRERHSRKLSALFDAMSNDGNVWNHPRVNVSTGAILEKRTVDKKSANIPHSVCGYADWLYSRRNALVHGAGSASFLENDRAQIKKLFKVEVGRRIIIKVGSITNAAKFYESVCTILKEA